MTQRLKGGGGTISVLQRKEGFQGLDSNLTVRYTCRTMYDVAV